MAKKTKDATASAATKDAKAKAPADPATARSLIRLLNILALLLAITAFLLQFFAVITHHWKWQVTGLRPIFSANGHAAQSNDDSDVRLEQRYGLYSRDIKLYAHNDEQLSAQASTRFPRIDDGEENFNHCLSGTSTLRGALLTCSDRVISPKQCHCRRYPYWNAVIVFEILALILLGIVVFICALLTTQYGKLLKLAGVGLSFLAFLFMLIGLILILSYLKRETRTIADTYPHTYNRLTNTLGIASHRYPTVQHQIVRRQAHETYRAYNLLSTQRAYNDTHFIQYSEQHKDWFPLPYTSLNSDAYAPRSPQGRPRQSSTTRQTTSEAPLYNSYGPLLGYDQVYEHTRAGIGWSTVLSILSLILALLLPLILAFSWLTGNKLGPEVKTVTTTTVRTEYVPIPQEVTVETVPLNRPIPTEYDSRRPVGDAVVTTQNVNYGARGEPVAVHIRDEHPSTTHTYRT